jgi:serine/threonine protein kinase
MFSIGVIAYVLLGGYLPYECTTRALYKKQVLRGRVEFHAPYWNNVSSEAKDLIKKLLNSNPEKRLTAGEALKHQWVRSFLLEYLTRLLMIFFAGLCFQITEPGSLLKSHDLLNGLVQLKKFNARRKFRSVVNLLIAKAKFERIVEACKLTRLSLQHVPTPPFDINSSIFSMMIGAFQVCVSILLKLHFKN